MLQSLVIIVEIPSNYVPIARQKIGLHRCIYGGIWMFESCLQKHDLKSHGEIRLFYFRLFLMSISWHNRFHTSSICERALHRVAQAQGFRETSTRCRGACAQVSRVLPHHIFHEYTERCGPTLDIPPPPFSPCLPSHHLRNPPARTLAPPLLTVAMVLLRISANGPRASSTHHQNASKTTMRWKIGWTSTSLLLANRQTLLMD
jgi:hypothetical protein